MKLGQHFLKSKNIVKKIIRLADVKETDIVLEVGPGKGILTEELLKKAKKVIAIEKDERLFEFLSEKFKQEINDERFILIEGDALKNQKSIRQLADKSQKYKIVANIPYYITSRFLKIFLEESARQPEKMVLMLQKEVAERICASPPDMGLLAVSVQAYGKPKIGFKVNKKYFSPKPKVDSAVIAINDISRDFFKNIGENNFFNLVKKGFSHKRKFLINNLRGLSDKESFEKCEINLKARPQELSPKNWKCLTATANSGGRIPNRVSSQTNGV